MRAVFDKLSVSYAKYYSLTDHLVFKQYIPKKPKQFVGEKKKLQVV